MIIVALHEATSTGDPELVQSVLQYRDYQRYTQRTDGIPALLRKIREVSACSIKFCAIFGLPISDNHFHTNLKKGQQCGHQYRIRTPHSVMGYLNFLSDNHYAGTREMNDL